tara:strand:- start:206 stop:826 length:621 start_codon:yes stop_codon:yes gene_type:complete
MEYYIYNIPVFVVNPPGANVNLPDFCAEVEALLPQQSLLRNIEVVYIGQFRELQGRNATYAHGAIYMSNTEPTNFDMMENFIHEVAHSLERDHAWDIYSDDLLTEFKGKRSRLYQILHARGYQVNPMLFAFAEYNKNFDEFLSDEVGYPTLLNLTMGLFVSPYGATSIQEYFANGFEKYFLDSPQRVKNISPILYTKIEDIINDNM